jgi:hypothetical protein
MLKFKKIKFVTQYFFAYQGSVFKTSMLFRACYIEKPQKYPNIDERINFETIFI